MKYTLMAFTLTLVAVAVFVMTALNRRVDTAPSTVAASAPATSLAEPKVSRQAAVEYGRMISESYGEEAPVLVDAVVTTHADAERRTYPEGGPIDGPVEGHGLVADDALVWFVRMRGIFSAPHGLTHDEMKGWTFTIVDAETGQIIQSGFRPEDMPIR